MDSIPSLGSDDDIPSPGPSADRVEFDLHGLLNLGSNNEVGDIQSPGCFGDQDEFDWDSMSSFGSDDEVKWEVDPYSLQFG